MKMRNITSISCVLLFMILISCNDERNEIYNGEKVKATFTAGISTRATDVMWDVNDEIGLAMLDPDLQTVINNVYNNKYYTTTASGNFVPATPNDVIYFPQNGDEVAFKAYYPYSETTPTNLMIPLSVADQTDMPAIDFMSAEHLSGTSKDDPNVNLRFYHRLSKAIFRISAAQDVPDLQVENVTLTVKGMRTTGVYDLINDTLAINDGSIEDLVIPRRSAANERVGIVMPREAGEGVSFELTTPEGSTFTAEMGNDLTLQPGYKYVFNIQLQGTEMTVSVTIEDWVEGPVTTYDIIGTSSVAGESYGAIPGDQMQVYILQNNVYQELSLFTYQESGNWTTENPVFWEDIEGNEVELRASIIPREPARNETQLPDILLSGELQVERNTGADFVFNHVGSRVVVELQSNVFSEEELENAVITLPNYFAGGREENGAFIPGTTRRSILVDRTDPEDQFAIIQPQSISAGGGILNISIAGRNFTATVDEGGFLYEAGVAYKLIALVNESEVTVSARIIDWVDGGTTNYDVLGVTTPVDETYGAIVGDQMRVYRRTTTGFEDFRTFTYGADGRWTTPSPVFWDEIEDNTVDLRAAIEPREPAKNETQLPDIMVAAEQSVARNSGANFVFNHVGSRVVVALQSNVFTAEDLANAVITLPDYIGGGREEQGEFIPGDTRMNILVDRSNPQDQFAIIQPQPISPQGALVNVNINGRDFVARATTDGFEYRAGFAYKLIVLVNESEVTVSARIIDWIDGGTTNYDILGITTPAGESYGAVAGDQMQVYLRNGADFNDFRIFTYGNDGRWTTTAPVFWDEITESSLDLRAALRPRQPARNATQMPDIMVAQEQSIARNTGANFTFNHAGSRVVVALQSNVFSRAELDAATITLPNYFGGGSEQQGVFIPGDSRLNILVDRSNPDDNFAIIQPQSVSPGGDLVTVNISGRNFTARASSGGFNYQAGVAYKLIVMVNESEVSVSARIVDWVEGSTTTYDVLGVTTPVGDSYGAEIGDQMRVYVRENNQFEAFRTFTYGSDGRWTTPSPVYWDEVTSDALDLRASLVPRAPAKNPTQLPDILIAEEQTVPRNSGADFVFNHACSRVVVVLQSNFFSQQDLNGAVITLPNYLGGGREDRGIFIPGTTRKNIIVDRTDPQDQYAIIQPQSVSAGGAIVEVNINGKTFTGRAGTNGFLYEAGVISKLIVTVNESEVAVSARVNDWVLGSESWIIAD